MFIILLFLIICIVFYKYHIDTKLTIDSLIKDRNQFRTHAWNLLNRRNIENNNIKNNDTPYQQLKLKIKMLKDDLSETDFANFDNIKDEILSALDEIDSYGESK